MSRQLTFLPDDYDGFLRALKERIRAAQIRAALSVNRELVLLYWHIGREILLRQEQEGWGAKIIERLAKDLKRDFPQMEGFSRSNLMYMRAFATAYPDESIVQAPLGQITWYHNITLVEKVKDLNERLWYIRKTLASLPRRVRTWLESQCLGTSSWFCKALVILLLSTSKSRKLHFSIFRSSS